MVLSYAIPAIFVVAFAGGVVFAMIARHWDFKARKAPVGHIGEMLLRQEKYQRLSAWWWWGGVAIGMALLAYMAMTER